MRTLKTLLIILILLTFCLAGYFIFFKNFFDKKLDAADLVDGNAIFLFETNEPIQAWNALVDQPIWNRLSDIPSLKLVEQQLLDLDSLLGGSGQLDKSLKGNKLAISLHPTGREDFDFLFSLSFPDNDQKEFLKDLESKLRGKGQINQRNYSGRTIYEYRNAENEGTLSYSLIHNVLIASQTSFLVEDAIRHDASNDLVGFKEKNRALYTSLPHPKGLGVLRIDSQGLGKFIEGISANALPVSLQSFSKLGVSANLELQFAANKVFMDGFAFFKDGQKVNFGHTTSQTVGLFSNFISNRTALFYQYNLQDVKQIREIQQEGFQGRNTVEADIENLLLDKSFLEQLSGEIGYMVLENDGSEGTDQIMLLGTKDIQGQLALLKNFSLSINQEDSTHWMADYYLDKEIFLVEMEEFPAHLFEGQFKGFQNTYIAQMNDMLIFGNNLKAIRIFLDDLYMDNTWGKSIVHRRFLEGISKESGFNFLINIPRLWSTILRNSTPNWKVLFQKYAPQLQSLDLIALQLSEAGANQYVNLELGYNLAPIKPVKDVTLEETKSFNFPQKLTYGPISLQNFNDKSIDFLVQGASNQIYLLNGEGDMIFSQAIDGPIVSPVFQIDFYKNGKLQLLFATANSIHALDRLGNSLPNYPISRPGDAPFTHLSLVDYNNTRDYRYFVGSSNGDLFLFNQKGEALEGWNPKPTRGPLANAPAHHRISGMGDFMVSLNKNGELYFMNRRGEVKGGNPIQIGQKVNTDYALIQRSKSSETLLTTITEDGEIVQVNFRGELSFRNQLTRPDRETKFHLVRDQSSNQHVFVVNSFNKISILNQELEPLFEKNIMSDELTFQYFTFGGDKNIFVVIDPIQEFIYLYNLKGELLNTRPINGALPIQVKYSGSQNEYSITTVFENRWSEFKMPL
ncbi:hypothetical protein [Pararhodonellum marinum]|uniref:hypothetical protein n=1 Tax=Pararhodonellum marinum TaxID=2755358 RepID=UPI00293BC2AF|nr:hypothetical protein [Pararhodonellum marinum]